MVPMNMAATPADTPQKVPPPAALVPPMDFIVHLVYFALLSNYPLECQLQMGQDVGLLIAVSLVPGTCGEGMME